MLFPAFRNDSLTACGKASIAKFQTALPSIWKYCEPSTNSSESNGVLTPPDGISITDEPEPSDISHELMIPFPSLTSDNTAAPAPSPNNTQVALSFQFNIRE